MFNAYFLFFFRSFLKFTAARSLGYTYMWFLISYKKLESTAHTFYIRLYSAVRRGGSRDNDAAGNTTV